MTTFTCPSCNHSFPPSSAGADSTPDASVVHWFSTDNSSMGNISTAEAYLEYLRSAGDTPVSRRHFVADLDYLGVEEVLDGDIHVLIRD